MKPIMNEETYKKRVHTFLFKFPTNMIITAIIVVFFYKVITSMGSGTLNLSDPELYANSFFNGTVAAVIVYFLKSRTLDKIFDVDPDTFTKGKVHGYIPCVNGIWPNEYKGGFLVFEGSSLTLHMKKTDGFVKFQEWKDVSKVKFTTVKEPYNVFLFLIFGLRESLLISDGKTSAKIIFEDITKTVSELEIFQEEFLKIEFVEEEIIEEVKVLEVSEEESIEEAEAELVEELVEETEKVVEAEEKL